MENGCEDSVGLFFVTNVSDRCRNANHQHIPFSASDSDGMILCFEGVEGPPSSMR